MDTDTDPDYTLSLSQSSSSPSSPSSSHSSHSSSESISNELKTIQNLNATNEHNIIDPSSTASNLSTIELFLSHQSNYSSFISKNEVPRKVFHSSIGFVTLYLYTKGVTQYQLIAPLSSAFAIVLTFDYLRFHNEDLNKKFCSLFWFMMRSSEIDHYNGILWYLLGLIIIFSTCPKDISLMSVLLLSWADTAASTFGRKFGYLTPKLSKNKSLAGSLAAFVVGIIACLVVYVFIEKFPQVNLPNDIFYNETESNLSFPIYCLLSGFIASFSEFISIFNWDDNFTIPVFSGWFLYATVRLFHN